MVVIKESHHHANYLSFEVGVGAANWTFRGGNREVVLTLFPFRYFLHDKYLLLEAPMLHEIKIPP